MEFVEINLKGAYAIRFKKIEDERGYFTRAWCKDEFLKHGLNPGQTQLNTAYSLRRGTVRGMHFQLPPDAEAKFIRCTRGAIYDVIIDLRAGSPTLGQWYGAELTSENGLMLYAPEGFAHGYQTLQDDSEMYYMTTAPYSPASARGVRHDDPAFGVEWPLPVSSISAADQKWPHYVP